MVAFVLRCVFSCSVVSLAIVALVFFMKRSVAEKGERLSAE